MRAGPSKTPQIEDPPSLSLESGPIGSPGQKTIEAALNPAKGDWLYFVAVNLETGETVFSETKAEHDKAVGQLQEYCRGTDVC